MYRVSLEVWNQIKPTLPYYVVLLAALYTTPHIAQLGWGFDSFPLVK